MDTNRIEWTNIDARARRSRLVIFADLCVCGGDKCVCVGVKCVCGNVKCVCGGQVCGGGGVKCVMCRSHAVYTHKDKGY